MEKHDCDNSSILVIIAALNEEQGLGPTLTEVKGSLNNSLCLVVDGRSTDGTVKIAEAMGSQVICQKGTGKGDAIGTAIEHAKRLGIKYVGFIDADFTYPAGYFPYMIKILEENPEIGMVCGNRFTKQLHLGAMATTFHLGNRFLSLFHNLFNGVRLVDPLTGLRIVRWEILKNWWPKSKGFDVEVELNHLVENEGFSIIEIPICYRERLGEKKLKPAHGLIILKRILTESFSSTRRVSKNLSKKEWRASQRDESMQRTNTNMEKNAFRSKT